MKGMLLAVYRKTACVLLGVTFILGLTLDCAAVPKRRQQTRKEQKGVKTMLPDEKIKEAIADGGSIVIVKSLKAESAGQGTRAHQTTYQLEVKESILGELSGTIQVKQYGGVLLQPGKFYVLLVFKTQHMGQKLSDYAEVPEAQIAESATAHAEKVKQLSAGKARQP